MKEIINQLLANDLRDLSGLKMRGQIPVQEQFLNELIKEMHTDQAHSGSSTQPGTSSKSKGIDMLPSSIDLGKLLSHVQRLQVEMQEGRMIVHFEIRVD